MTDGLIEDILQGKPRAVAQAISHAENNTEESRDILKSLYPQTGGATIVGITGSPGSGKSTLVNCLVGYLVERDVDIGVIAVDPTSFFSGGAMLGDRVRMQEHSTAENVFIRSMATRGVLGGVAAATRDAVDILDAAGKDVIIVETVGVGQDEIEIVNTVKTSVLVLTPGMGDEIQAIKAGVMEIADIFVINKSDLDGADKAKSRLEYLLSLDEEQGWRPEIVKTTASRGEGINSLFEAIEEHGDFLSESDMGEKRRKERLRFRIKNILSGELTGKVLNKIKEDDEFEGMIQECLKRQNDPYSVVETILSRVEID